MILALLTAAALGAAAPAPQSALSGSAVQAAAAVDAFHAALHRGDARAAATLLAPDALVFEEGYAERSKAEYAAHHLPADAEYSRAVSQSLTRRIGAGNGGIAWVASEGRTRGTFRGKAVDRLTTETMLLRRSAGRWSIVHIHWSARKPAGD